MYIKDIEIRRFMAFESAETEFLYPGAPDASNVRLPNMNVVIGDNGAGKTALLKAVAYALLSPVFANSQPYATRLVRTTSDYNPSTIMAASVKLPNPRDHEPADAEGTRLVSRIEHGKNNARFARNEVRRTDRRAVPRDPAQARNGPRARRAHTDDHDERSAPGAVRAVPARPAVRRGSAPDRRPDPDGRDRRGDQPDRTVPVREPHAQRAETRRRPGASTVHGKPPSH